MTMMTRTSGTWRELPGSFDTLNTRWLFVSDNAYGIPAMQPNTALAVPEWLVPYRTRVRDQDTAQRGAVHFFLDDYRFEATWSRPWKALQGLTRYGGVLTPDFSLYRDWPFAAQLWNTYRSRWLGAFWQAQGLAVIPTVSWSGPESYQFCFLGIPPGSLVAVATLGVRDSEARRLFAAGFLHLLTSIQPSHILCYGLLPTDLLRRATCQTQVTLFPTRWAGIRAARAHRQSAKQR